MEPFFDALRAHGATLLQSARNEHGRADERNGKFASSPARVLAHLSTRYCVEASALAFSAGSMTDWHSQNSLACLILYFNLLVQAASRSPQGSLTQNVPGALNCFATNRVHGHKLLTLSIIREKRIAVS
jgi:hypothetical protein